MLSQRRETRRVRNGASCPWPSCVVSHSCDEHIAACNDVQSGCGRTHGKRLLCGGGDSRYASVADGSTAGSPASDLIAWNLPLALARRRADVHVHLDSARTSRSPAALANSIAAGRRVASPLPQAMRSRANDFGWIHVSAHRLVADKHSEDAAAPTNCGEQCLLFTTR